MRNGIDGVASENVKRVFYARLSPRGKANFRLFHYTTLLKAENGTCLPMSVGVTCAVICYGETIQILRYGM